MNPNVNTPPEFHLPEPLPTGNASAERLPMPESAPETMPAARPEAAGNQPAAPAFPLPMQPAQNAPAAVPAAQPVAAAPATASDDDIIEKEWIDKAKQIVRSTQADPYQQNRQLAAFKADYMHKRYGKTVKISE